MPLFCDFEEWAMDRDVRNAIDEAMIGAAAIGFCLARALAETDPEVAHRLDPIWKDTYAFLRELGRGARGRYRIMFAAATRNPERFQTKPGGPNELSRGCNVVDFEAERQSYGRSGQ